MPESGRDDYDRLIRFSQLDPGEPYFFIRGRDQVGAAAVRAWAALAYAAGAPIATIESALQQADRLEAWPTKQLPDADHLTDAEALQLRFQFDRRAWNARLDGPDPAIMLAEARGAAQARNQERHADGLLISLLDAVRPVLAKSGSAEQIARAEQAILAVLQDLARRNGDVELPGDAGELVPFPTAAQGA